MTNKINEELEALIEAYNKAGKVSKDEEQKKKVEEKVQEINKALKEARKDENEAEKDIENEAENEIKVNEKKVEEVKDDNKKTSSKAKKIIAGLTCGALIAAIIFSAKSCSKKKDNKEATKAVNKDNSSYSSVEDIKSFDPTNDKEVREKAQKIYGYVNTENMKYSLDFIEDAVRILNEVAPKNQNTTLDDVIDFLYNWADKCIVNSVNYIGGVEKFKGNAPEIHYAEFFDKNSIDYEAINNYDEMVNKATHSSDFNVIYNATNEMLKDYYQVIELNGKETEYGLANRNSMSTGGIAVYETEIVDTLPLLEEIDNKNQLNWDDIDAVVDKSGNELEGHGYDNTQTKGINVIKLRLNPLSREEYELYFKSIFEDVYGIKYSEVKKLAAKSLTTHENNTAEIPDYAFYKNLKSVIGEQARVEYENQMLNMEALTRLFYSYYTGEIQTAEESDLNQNLRALEEKRLENCKVKTK